MKTKRAVCRWLNKRLPRCSDRDSATNLAINPAALGYGTVASLETIMSHSRAAMEVDANTSVRANLLETVEAMLPNNVPVRDHFEL